MSPRSAMALSQTMAAQLIHRGPDGEGHWQSEDGKTTLSHRRLSILELSPLGAQPMISPSGRYVTAFNGEIYNHRSLRLELEKFGFRFSGGSDTEVLLAAMEQWGFDDALRKFVGMFALAVFDKKENCLLLARDRMGEKPLYYGFVGGDFVFASELKALTQHPKWSPQIDQTALGLYFRHGYVPSPFCIYQGLRKLTPGHALKIKASDLDQANLPSSQPYWRLLDQLDQPPLDLSDEDATSELCRLMKESIGLQMVADVPVGCFLSGGIDSSTVAAIMQDLSAKPIRTFTIGFHEQDFNEAQYAKRVAEHLRTDHTELYVTPAEAMDVIPKLPQIYDEPFADVSQIPTFLLSQRTKKYVTVSLSGDGGDELFAGYNRYFWAQRVWNKLGHVPLPIRKALTKSLSALGPSKMGRAYQNFKWLLPKSLHLSNPGDKLQKAVEVMGKVSFKDVYDHLLCHFKDSDEITKLAPKDMKYLLRLGDEAHIKDPVLKAMFIDTLSYLPDDILVKVDRAAMAVSLETRVPLLDHRIVEWAWRVPMRHKIRNGQGKWLLRQVFKQYLPESLMERPKMGFGVPIDRWLRGPLKEWALGLLSDASMNAHGFLDTKRIQLKVKQHLSGERDWHYQLWVALMFQAWWQENLNQQRQLASLGVPNVRNICHIS